MEKFRFNDQLSTVWHDNMYYVISGACFTYLKTERLMT